MPRSQSAAIPAAPRKTLLEWIEHDDGNTTGFPQLPCSAQALALHAQILPEVPHKGEAAEPLQPVGLKARPARLIS
ncbi:hypothetical protein ACFQGS_18750, partial [Novosphingobium lubricantis]